MTDEITMYGTAWCGDCKRAKKFFGEQRVKYNFIDIEDNEDAVAIVERANDGKHVGRVHIRKYLAERAVIRLNTRTMDGKTMNLTGGMYHVIPIAKYLKSAPAATEK